MSTSIFSTTNEAAKMDKAPKLQPYNAQTYADAWFRRLSLEAMASNDEFFVGKGVAALYVQLVQLSNAAACVIGDSIGNLPPLGAGSSSLALLKSELSRTHAVLKTEELEADAERSKE